MHRYAQFTTENAVMTDLIGGARAFGFLTDPAYATGDCGHGRQFVRARKPGWPR
jgi:hypothetical protein